MKRIFGTTHGREVSLYTLVNSSGAELSITDYGGIVTAFKVPDTIGHLRDMVLGFDNLEDYLTNNYYFGCLVGRYANRIADGRFSLDGKEYALVQNDYPNHLHGGDKGFDKVIWDARLIDGSLGQELELIYTSRDGEEGYPGNLMVRVNYRLTDENGLVIDYYAVTDVKTVASFTHHSYFNLSDAPTILDHELFLRADSFTPVDEDLIPTGELQSVAGTELDFRISQRIGESIEKAPQYLLAGGFDHNFILSCGDCHQPAARLIASDSDWKLEVFTTEPGLQVYTGNHLNGSVAGKGGKTYMKYGGICLEAQHYPDSPNKPGFPSVILCPGEVYRQTTSYIISPL